MRTRKTQLSRGIYKRKSKARRSFNSFCNRRKLSRLCQRMSIGRNVGSSIQPSTVITLIDDDNVASHSRAERFREEVHGAFQEGKIGKRGSEVRNPLDTSIVDLSNDQELSSDQEQDVFTPQSSRARKRKRKSRTIRCKGGMPDCKKLKNDNPSTDVGDVINEVKILGLNTGVKNIENEVVMLPEDIIFKASQNSPQKSQEVKPTCSLENVHDKPASPDSTKTVLEKQETNNSIVILDSDDDCPVVERPKGNSDYIPLVRKRFDTSIEVLEDIVTVPESPDLLVVKHISRSVTGMKQKNEDVIMFEDRTGNFEQFYSADFWKKLKSQNEGRQSKKQKVGHSADAENQPKPVKQRDDSNIYNPTPVFEKGGLRPVIIDGNNVAWGHGNHTHFSAPGLEICINYFVQRKHRVIAFVPQYRKTKKFPGLIEILEKYEKLGQIVMTPSRKIDGKTVSSYDDRYIVQAATELGGVIVSTDNYRDLMAENERWKETIEKRLLMFTWVGDMLMFPQDPLGRNGPSLEEFLRFPD